MSWTQPVVEVANFTEYVRSSFDFFKSTWKSMFGNSSDSNRNDTGADVKRRSCLCIFDVDRMGRMGIVGMVENAGTP